MAANIHGELAKEKQEMVINIAEIKKGVIDYKELKEFRYYGRGVLKGQEYTWTTNKATEYKNIKREGVVSKYIDKKLIKMIYLTEHKENDNFFTIHRLVKQ